MFSRSSNTTELLRILYGLTGSEKFKMATAKPELLKSQLVGMIATKFQWLSQHRRVNINIEDMDIFV